MLCCAILCHVMLCLWHIASCSGVLRCDILGYAISGYAMTCYAIVCPAALCQDVFCNALSGEGMFC